MRLSLVVLACAWAITSGAAVERAQAGWSAAGLDDLAAYVQSQKTTGFLIIQDRSVISEHNCPLPPQAATFSANFTHGTDAHGALQEDVASGQKSFIAVLTRSGEHTSELHS